MARPLIEILRHLNGGCYLDEAADSMAELVTAVESTGKPGKITLEISLRRATAGALAVTGKVKMNKPADQPCEALMFPTPEGNLLTEDPRQGKLDLKPVNFDKPQLRTVA